MKQIKGESDTKQDLLQIDVATAALIQKTFKIARTSLMFSIVNAIVLVIVSFYLSR